ncbi:hypothetical protein LguiA_007840 [Lonicera macranthoides]
MYPVSRLRTGELFGHRPISTPRTAVVARNGLNFPRRGLVHADAISLRFSLINDENKLIRKIKLCARKKYEDMGNKQQRTITKEQLPALGSDPWLVFIHGKKNEKHTIYKISDNKYHAKSIRCMREKYVLASYHGWMVLAGMYSDDCCLFNPTTGEKILLPPLEITLEYHACVLSLPPSDPCCTLLFITNSEDDEGVVSLRFCRPTMGRVVHWVQQQFKLEDDRIQSAMYYNGKIYAITYFSKEIFTFEVSDDNNAVPTIRKIGMHKKIPRPLLPEAYVIDKNLVESCGELYVVKIYMDELMPREIKDMEVFKLDCNKKVWLRVESLGDRAFLLGPNCCTSCYASARESKYGIVRNTIYFTMENDTSLYAMDLEDRSITVSLPCPIVKKNCSRPIWLK